MTAAQKLSSSVGVKPACQALEISRATFYRKLNTQSVDGEKKNSQRPAPPLALELTEKQAVIDTLHSERFCDKAPRQVFATLLDEGQYLCSVRTMYRFLTQQHGDVKERRAHVKRPAYAKPELLATAPNQLWSWDITKLKALTKWTYFYLYVIMDVFSRYVVGWMVAHTEQASLAERLIKDSCQKQNISPHQLTLHADRGSSMKSKTVAQLLSDLEVTKTHSRPHVSNDNPYSEAQFKTLKYCPTFPGKFGSIQDSRSFCQGFFKWYNQEHYHSGIALMTPELVHYGLADKVYQHRVAVMTEAFERNPNRFKSRPPAVYKLPDEVWINKPQDINLRH